MKAKASSSKSDPAVRATKPSTSARSEDPALTTNGAAGSTRRLCRVDTPQPVTGTTRKRHNPIHSVTGPTRQRRLARYALQDRRDSETVGVADIKATYDTKDQMTDDFKASENPRRAPVPRSDRAMEMIAAIQRGASKNSFVQDEREAAMWDRLARGITQQSTP